MATGTTAAAPMSMSGTPTRASPAIRPSSAPTPSNSPVFSLSTYTTTPLTRLPALYSNIPSQKHSNPASYYMNVDWWRRVLEEYVYSGLQNKLLSETWQGSRLILRAWPGLLDIFRVEGAGKPLGLGAVIMELRNSKAFVPVTPFLATTESVYDPGWFPARIAAYVLGKPLWWALEQLGVVEERHAENTSSEWWNEYVVLALVEKAANAVVEMQMSRVAGPAVGLYTFEGFRREFGAVLGQDGTVLGTADAKVLLKFLERDRHVVYVDSEGDLVKFIQPHATADSHINAIDRGILELKTAVEHLQAQINGVQTKINDSTRKASSALQQKQKTVALSYLRSRKQLEEILTKRVGSLEILENMLMRVDSAAGDIDIMKSYESSTATLRAILAHPSLQRDRVDETMEAMAQASEEARDIQEAMQIGGDVAMGVLGPSDAELEQELGVLVSEIERQERAKDAEGMAKLAGIATTPGGLPREKSGEWEWEHIEAEKATVQA